MPPALQKINDLLKQFNETFTLESKIETDESGEEIVTALKIGELQTDGETFIKEIMDLFSQIISSVDDSYSLIYDENRGLAIAKKKVITTYEIEE